MASTTAVVAPKFQSQLPFMRFSLRHFATSHHVSVGTKVPLDSDQNVQLVEERKHRLDTIDDVRTMSAFIHGSHASARATCRSRFVTRPLLGELEP
jgi:hypothetical protein